MLKSLYKRIKNKFKSSTNTTSSKLYLHARTNKNKLTKGSISFVSFTDITDWTNRWIQDFPESYDMIVGIPRNGLLVANIIASKLSKPLSTPDLFIQNLQLNSIRNLGSIPCAKKVLLLDDCIDTGRQMEKAEATIKSHMEDTNITTAALFPHSYSFSKIDLYYKILPQPRLFEWELIDTKKWKTVGFDMDGVLCEECPDGYDSCERTYTEWLQNARPYLIPSYEIDIIVTNRLEHYRKQTEKWLKNHDISYNKLIMWNLISKKDRKGRYGARKTEVLLKEKPDFFFESSQFQAKTIWKQTKIPTFCVSNNILFS